MSKETYFNPRDEEEDEEELEVQPGKCIHCQHGMHQLCTELFYDSEGVDILCSCTCGPANGEVAF